MLEKRSKFISGQFSLKLNVIKPVMANRRRGEDAWLNGGNGK